MPFSSINFFHLPALALELPGFPWISWGCRPLPTPPQSSSWAPLAGGAALQLGGHLPSGDQASCDRELGHSSRLCSGPLRLPSHLVWNQRPPPHPLNSLLSQ